jgi:predicted transglutaminase-like cysteine proteinase
MPQVFVLFFVFLLGFILTAWASVGLPHEELSAKDKVGVTQETKEKQLTKEKQEKKNKKETKKKTGQQPVTRAGGINTLDALMDLTIPAPRGQKVFGASEVSFDHAAAYVGKIDALQRSLEKSRAAFAQPLVTQGDVESLSPYEQWQVFLRKTAYLSRKAQIEAVQSFINRTPYHHDSDSTGSGDTWKDPEDFLTFGGDSEDFAITKYISLRLLGLSPDRLRVAVVFDHKKDIYRAVTLVYANTDVLVLDETKNEINAARDLKDLSPVYSFNEKHIWYHWKQGSMPPNQFLQTETQRQYKIFP